MVSDAARGDMGESKEGEDVTWQCIWDGAPGCELWVSESIKCIMV